jgi:hypothetical protein
VQQADPARRASGVLTAVHAQREGSPEPVVRNPRTIWWKN